jgi:hypothetical protein
MKRWGSLRVPARARQRCRRSSPPEKRRRGGRLRRRLSVRVAIPILSIHLLNTWLKPKFDSAAQTLETAEIALRNPDFIGLRFSELRHGCPRALRSRPFAANIRTSSPQTL